MKILRTIFRIVWLPFDLVVLSRDCLRLGLWWLKSLLWRFLGCDLTPYEPCFRDSWSDDDATVRLCDPSARYGTPGLVRTLCPQCQPGLPGEQRRCDGDGIMRVSVWRLFGTGLVLAVFWAGIAALLWFGAATVRSRLAAAAPWRARPAAAALAAAAQRPRDVATPEDWTAAQELTEQGMALLRAGRADQARNAFDRAASLDPQNPEPRHGLGLCELARGEWAGAFRHFQGTLLIHASHPGAHLELARLALREDKIESATRHATAADAAMADNVEAKLLLADLALRSNEPARAQQMVDALRAVGHEDMRLRIIEGKTAAAKGDRTAARAAFESILDTGPDVIEARLALASVLTQDDELGQAEKHLDAVLAANPEHVEALQQLAVILDTTGRIEAALAVYTRLAAAAPGRTLARTRLAELQLQAGRVDAAQQTAQALIDENPGHVGAHLLLADMFRRAGFLGLAEKHCASALANDPRLVKGIALRAAIRFDQGNLRAAVTDMEQILGVTPNDLAVGLRLGLAQQYLGDAAAARARFTALAAGHPLSPLPNLHLAQLAVGLGDFDAAIESYRHVLRIDAANSVALNNLAILNMDHKGDIAEGHRLAARVWQLNPFNPTITDTYAWSLHLTGNHARALELLQVAAAHAPENGSMRYHLATILFTLEQPREARAALARAFELGLARHEMAKARELMRQLGESP